MAPKKILIGIWLAAAFWLAFIRPVWARQWDYKPTGYVNDYAQVFSPSYRQELEAKLRALEAATSAQLAVVTIESLEGDSIEPVAVQLFEQWQIGEQAKDNGILLLIAFSDHQVRLEVGYGLESVITDGRAGRIIREQIAPAFKRDDYEGGVELAIEEITTYLHLGEPVSETVKTEAAPMFSLLVFISLIIVYAASFLSRSRRIWPGGILGIVFGLALGAINGAVLWLVLWPIFLGFLGLFLDWFFSRNYQKRKSQGKSTSFWSSWGGFSSGGGSGGGSFGGFGGGSSGGGGASGSW